MTTQTHEKGRPFDPFAPQTPDAETIARSLSGRKVGENDWRLAHLCAGAAPGDPLGDNPGLSVGDGGKGLIVFCHYGCDTATAYTAVRSALGIENRRPERQPPVRSLRCPDCRADIPATRMIPNTGWPALSCTCGATYDTLISAIVGRPLDRLGRIPAGRRQPPPYGAPFPATTRQGQDDLGKIRDRP